MKTLLISILVLAVGFIEPSFASQAPTFQTPLIQLSQAGNHSLDQAVHKIKKQSGGRILSAKTIRKGSKQVHVIKVLLPSGKVRIFKVNAR